MRGQQFWYKAEDTQNVWPASVSLQTALEVFYKKTLGTTTELKNFKASAATLV